MSVGPADPKSLQALPTWVVGSPIPPVVRIGKLLQGEYLIKSILGEGELGVTYEAENARLKRKFAVQMLKRELKPTQGMMLQVRDDLRRAEPLMHAGIMPVKMIVDHMMIPGFATELLEGETLRARCSRGPLPPPRALAVVRAVARALDALHKAGAVHGDLRPENIFLVRPGAKSSFAGRVMVVEHALHPLRRRSQGLDDQLPLYKLMYRPPECLAGERGPHIGGDVFVLGAILHESLTGRPAFYDEVADFVIDNLNQPPKPIPANPATGLTPELAAALSVLVASACARDPEMRTPDMAEIIVAIDQVAQGAGLTLPAVITEEPQAVSAAPATPTATRMNRLLHRLSGVFPQIPLPPVTDPVGGSQPIATPAGAAGSTALRDVVAAGGSDAAPGAVKAQATTMPPIVAPRKVTRLLQKLSGVFPVLQVAPDGTLEQLASSHPKIAGAVLLASQPPVPEPPTPAPVPAEEPPAGKVPEPETQPALASPPAVAEAVAAPLPVPPASEKAQPPLAEQAVTGPGFVAAPPIAATAAAEPPAEPLSPAVLESAVVPPAVSAATPPAELPQAGKGSEVAKALALLRLQQQARAAGQPADAQRLGAGPATPESVVPAFMAAHPGPASALSPVVPQPAAGAGGSTAPSATSPRATVPPVAAGAPVDPSMSSPVVAASAPAAGSGSASEAVTPPLSFAPSILSPTSERPTAGPPAAVDIGLDSTLAPDDLADFIEAAAANLEAAAAGPKTLSEIPTRPAAMTGLDPLARYTEAKTQPALRRLPITEQATQAKLNPELLAQLTGLRDAGPDPSGAESAAAIPTSPGATAPAAVEATPAPEPSSPAAPPMGGATRSAAYNDSLVELEDAGSILQEAPPPATPTPPLPDKPTPPRPPRVSQLIKALQQGQIDQFQALQQASGGPVREPPASATGKHAVGSAANVPASAPAASSGGQPSGQNQAISAQGRVSPGIMPLAPVPPTTNPADSPFGTATQHVVPASPPGMVAPAAGMRGFLLRNQEVMAALLGALLVLLAGIGYLLLR